MPTLPERRATVSAQALFFMHALRTALRSLRTWFQSSLPLASLVTVTAFATLPASRALAAPANDNFANATVVTLSYDSAAVTASSVGATKESGEPNHAGVAGGASVWWKVTAPSTGAFVISTTNGYFDTALGVYTGSNLGSLTEVASNDDASANTTGSYVTVSAAAGTTYYIAVDGKNALTGDISLAVTFVQPIAPTFSSGPQGFVAAYDGQQLWFYANTSGVPAPTLQWQRFPAGGSGWVNLTDGGGYSGTRTYQLVIDSATVAMNGDQLRCVATNLAGTAYSTAATLIINPAVAPAVLTMPGNALVNSGDSFYLSPTITGTPTLTYQWKKDGVAISGATSSSYSKSGATSADSGSYTVTVTNGAGSVTSPAALITVGAPTLPVIEVAPITRTLASGEWLTLSMNASGTPPITYQWKKDGVDLAGATSNYYSKNGVTTADSGVYSVTLTNSVGSVTGTIATVVVTPAQAPVITNLPSGLTFESGDYLSLSGNVTGSQPITFVWKKDNVTISGATSSNYSRSNATPADGGTYLLTATNSAGSASAGVVVTVNPPIAPSLYGFPTSVTQPYGSNLSLSGGIRGSQPMTFQWKKDGVDIAGATSSSLYKSNLTAADAGSYVLTATNAAGSANSTSITVAIGAPTAPRIGNMPSYQVISYGDGISIYPQVSGTQPMTYQWKKDGVDIPNATNLSLNLSNRTPADNGDYTLVATNAYGTATSLPTYVVIMAAVAPTISNVPSSVVVPYGEYLSLSPSIGGSYPRTYQWTKDGQILSSETSSGLYRYPATAANSGAYVLTVTNSAGTAISSPMAVTVAVPVAPAISPLPPSLTVTAGEPFSLYTSVTGSPSITYQWRKDGVAIAGGTADDYYRSEATASDAGTYTLVATNVVGSTTSSPVVITVTAPVAPAVLDVPATLTLVQGDSFQLAPTITGSRPRTYQWKKDGVAISNATNESFYRSGATPADSGLYTVTVTNSVGSVTSSGCLVTVTAAVAPVIFGLPASVTVSYGQSLGLNPTVTGTQSISYQWRKDGVLVPGGNSSSFNRTATLADGGTYVLTASNVAGVTQSSPVVVTVLPAVAPVISNLPTTIASSEGETVYFNPSFGGTTPMAYQWMKDGVEIPGANSSSYSKALVTPAHNGTYTVVATNVAGTTTSSGVVLTVSPAVPAVISGLPASLSLAAGTTLYLSPTVSGSSPRTYQWKKDGAALPEATAQYLNIGVVAPIHSGSYTLTVTNAAGSVTSSPVEVTVAAPIAPVIAGLPSTVVIEYGGSLNLYPTVVGTAPMTFQWLKDGVALNGYTSSSYNRYSLTPADSGAYTLSVTNAVGTTVSAPVTVTVNPAVPPTITQQPVSTTVVAGTNVIFTVQATGANSLSYQWARNGTPLPGSTNSTLSLTNVQEAQAGTYTVTVTNPGGEVTSNGATLTLVAPKGVVNMEAGGGHTLFIKADGSLWSMGRNSSGQLGDGTFATRLSPGGVATAVTQVAAGNNHSLILTADGSLWATGANNGGQLGDATFTNRSLPVLVATDVMAAAAGNQHSAFVKADGTLWTMGLNYSGELGGGSIGSRYAPIQVATQVVKLAVGNSFTLFIKSDGSLWGMGYNGSGQLGDGSTTSRNLPVQIATGVKSVTAGDSHSLFIKTDDSLWAMGYNGPGQLGLGDSSNRMTPVQVTTGVAAVAAGYYHTLFVKTDGTLWAMGANDHRQLGDGTTTYRNAPVSIATDVADVAAGASYSLALKTDGSLWGVGYNGDGQLGNNTTSSSATWVLIASGPVEVPAAPTNVTASDGTVANAVRISWNGSLGASRWEIWRGNSITAATATKLVGNLTQTLYYDAVSAGTTYYYWVRAVNSTGGSVWGGSDSGYALIPPPQITLQPFAQVVTPGQPATFTAAANGVQPMSYQWRRNGVDVPGATSASLTIPAASEADLGIYTMIATNPGGSTATNGASLTFKSIIGAPDFNGDARSDLVWQNTQTGQTFLWLMNGSSVGSSVMLNSLSAEWSLAATADFNGDSKVDLVWQNSLTNRWRIWLMSGSTVASDVDMGDKPSGWNIVGSGDFNADGKADLVWRFANTGEYVAWFMNGTQVTGSGGWTANFDQPRVLTATGDFNDDGKTDLVWTNLQNGERRVWLMNGVNSTADVSLGFVDLDWTIVGTGDYNGDGRSDLVWSNIRTGDRSVWFMNGTVQSGHGSLGNVGLEWVLGKPQNPWKYIPRDFNYDGTSDLIWQNTVTGERLLWLMRNSAFQTAVPLSTVAPSWSIAGAEDINGDRKPDLVWQNLTTGERSIWLMDGANYFSSINLGVIGTDWVIAAMGDFYGDGGKALAWQNSTTGECVFWRLNSSGSLAGTEPIATSTTWSISGTYHRAGTAKAALVWTNKTTGERRIAFQGEPQFVNGAGSGYSLGVVPLEWVFASSGDYNADGETDIVWSNTVTGERYVWLMDRIHIINSVSLGTFSTDWQLVH